VTHAHISGSNPTPMSFKFLRVTGAGGVILDSDGQKLMEFSWGLGKSTNNNAKALIVYMGMCLITDNGSSMLVVIGDSDLIITGL
jgi:ribonuclease HI